MDQQARGDRSLTVTKKCLTFIDKFRLALNLSPLQTRGVTF